MQIKAKTIFEALPVITAIIEQARPMPQGGKFRLARMHRVLLPEYTTINETRNTLIKAYNHHPMVPRGSEMTPADMQALKASLQPVEGKTDGEQLSELLNEMVPSKEFSVPDDKMPEWQAEMDKIFAEEITIQIQPIPISMLSPSNAPNGSIEASEIAVMDGLVTELEAVQ